MNKDMILQLINVERDKVGLGHLNDNPQLATSAQERSEYLCETKSFSHDGWTNTVDYDYSLAGENLAKGFRTEQDMVDAWVGSPDHYKNIIESFQDSGIGVTDCEGVPYVVQHFGTPTEYLHLFTIGGHEIALEWLLVWSAFIGLGFGWILLLVSRHIKYTP